MKLPFFTTLLAFLATLCFMVLTEAPPENNDSYIKLSSDTFSPIVKEKGTLLVMFKSESCGYCQRALPEFEKAAKSFKVSYPDSSNLHFATVDCKDSSNICQEHGIKGYPTFKIVRDGFSKEMKIAERVSETFMKVLNQYRHNTIPTLKSADLSEILGKADKPALYVVKGKLEDHHKAMMTDLYLNYCDEFELVHMEEDHEGNDSVLGFKKLNSDDFQVSILRKSDSTPSVTSISKKDANLHNELLKFAFDEKLPLLAEIEPSNFHSFAESPKPLVFFFRSIEKDTDDSQKLIIEILKEQSKLHRKKLNFVLVDAAKYGQHAVSLGLTEDLPSMAVTNFTNIRNWLFDQKQELNKANIASFFKNIVDGTLPYHVRSEKEPATNDGDVRILTGNAAPDFLAKTEADILIFFHSEHCGHCKKFLPTYESAAKKLSSIRNQVVFTKLEATLNDYPSDYGFDVHGYPTLYLLTKGKKTVLYDGDRTVESLIEFVSNHADNGSLVAKLDETDKSEPKDAGEEGFNAEL